ncbi:peroxidase-related enzyme [Solirubrobacter soli]|uniref:peroxidase-related enzyme n=1 Tax=Solirubrobacter soli TaxID=363832 RepID=UPI000416A686|nr:peroxidase-related enzyme [Solirubrobacter soli]
MTWITTVAPEDATGALAEAYEVQHDKLGFVTELTQLGSLYPDLVERRLRLYDVVESAPSGVPPWARRAVALLTSVLNGCRFCTVGHTTKLEEAGRGELAAAIKAEPETASAGDPAVDALLDYTRKLVRRPGEIVEADVDALRGAGWSDLDILDVNDIAAYYSYINRVATGLGLLHEG